MGHFFVCLFCLLQLVLSELFSMSMINSKDNNNNNNDTKRQEQTEKKYNAV